MLFDFDSNIFSRDLFFEFVSTMEILLNTLCGLSLLSSFCAISRPDCEKEIVMLQKVNKRPHNICFFFKISVKEANKVSVPTEVASIAKTINPPTNCTGMKLEKINAPKDIFEAESSTIG